MATLECELQKTSFFVSAVRMVCVKIGIDDWEPIYRTLSTTVGYRWITMGRANEEWAVAVGKKKSITPTQVRLSHAEVAIRKFRLKKSVKKRLGVHKKVIGSTFNVQNVFLVTLVPFQVQQFRFLLMNVYQMANNGKQYRSTYVRTVPYIHWFLGMFPACVTHGTQILIKMVKLHPGQPPHSFWGSVCCRKNSMNGRSQILLNEYSRVNAVLCSGSCRYEECDTLGAGLVLSVLDSDTLPFWWGHGQDWLATK